MALVFLQLARLCRNDVHAWQIRTGLLDMALTLHCYPVIQQLQKALAMWLHFDLSAVYLTTGNLFVQLRMLRRLLPLKRWQLQLKQSGSFA